MRKQVSFQDHKKENILKLPNSEIDISSIDQFVHKFFSTFFTKQFTDLNDSIDSDLEKIVRTVLNNI